MNDHLTAIEQHEAKLKTSKRAVTKIMEQVEFLSDEDRRFVIEQVTASVGTEQRVFVPKTRGPRVKKDKPTEQQ